MFLLVITILNPVSSKLSKFCLCMQFIAHPDFEETHFVLHPSSIVYRHLFTSRIILRVGITCQFVINVSYYTESLIDNIEELNINMFIDCRNFK